MGKHHPGPGMPQCKPPEESGEVRSLPQGVLVRMPISSPRLFSSLEIFASECLTTQGVSISHIQDVQTKTTSNDFSLIRPAKAATRVTRLGRAERHPSLLPSQTARPPARAHRQDLQNLKMRTASASAIFTLEVYPTGFCPWVQTLFTLCITVKD